MWNVAQKGKFPFWFLIPLQSFFIDLVIPALLTFMLCVCYCSILMHFAFLYFNTLLSDIFHIFSSLIPAFMNICVYLLYVTPLVLLCCVSILCECKSII